MRVSRFHSAGAQRGQTYRSWERAFSDLPEVQRRRRRGGHARPQRRVRAVRGMRRNVDYSRTAKSDAAEQPRRPVRSDATWL